MSDIESANVELDLSDRRVALARYAALAGSACLVAYLGWRIPQGSMFMMLALLPALAAGGTLLARLRVGGGFAVFAGVVGALQSAIGLAAPLVRPRTFHPPDGVLPLLGCLVAGLVLVVAGGILARSSSRTVARDPQG